MTDPAFSFDSFSPVLVPVATMPPDFGLALAPPLTSFIGREREVVQISAVIARQNRVVTLVGPGGVGKTRLALAVASDLYGTFRHGASCVNLARISDAADVPSAIAAELGVHEGSADGPMADIATWIAGKELLLVLDNFEHVLTAAPKIQELLARCPALSILITSRSPIRISAERTVQVDPFPLPDTGGAVANPAMRLYVERACATDPTFRLNGSNAPAVAEVCRRLDGLPLAIELAAAHAHVLSPAALLARLDKRLQLLGGGPSDQPARLQTIRDTIAWSYDLLSPAAQRVFRAMAVFVGGARLEMCEAVLGEGGADAVATLRELVEQQLVTRTEETGGSDRFGMLQTILAFANEQLDLAGARDQVAARHAEVMLGFVAEYRAEMLGSSRQGAWLKRFDAEYANLRAAFEWLLASGHPERAIRIANRVFTAWKQLGRTGEGIEWVSRALERIAVEDDVDAVEGLGVLSSLHFLRGDFDMAMAYAERCAALATRIGADDSLCTALTNIGSIHNHKGDATDAIAAWDRAIVIARRMNGHDSIATLQNNAGIASLVLGDVSGARTRLGEAYRIHQTITGSKTGLTSVTTNLAQLAVVEENFPLARQLLQRCCDLAQETGDRDGLCWSLYAMGLFLGDREEFAAAEPYLFEACEIAIEMGMRYELIEIIEALLRLAAHSGRGLIAAKIAGFQEQARVESSVRRRDDEEETYQDALNAARAGTSATGFNLAWQAGSMLTLDELSGELRRGFGVNGQIVTNAPPPVMPSAVPVITNREREVLVLLVEGCSDRDVAERLFITRRTASQHVSAVYRKLGVTSRAAAVAVALKTGLA